MGVAMYKKKGYVAENVGAIITLIIGVGVASLVLIFVGALGGQTYNLVEDDIAAISDDNIKTSVENAIESGFEAVETSGQYLPIVVLAVIIAIVLTLVVGMGGGGGRSMYYGGAL